MKKKSKTIGILLGVLVILLVVFFGLKQWNASVEKKKEKKSSAEVVHIFEADGLIKMAYEDNTGQSMAFEKEGGIWKYSPDTTIAMAETTMSTMEETFSDIQAVKEIAEPDALSDYGLDEPQYKLTLKGNDGKERVFLVGNAVGENYYFMEEGQDKVYTVASELTDQMAWTLADVAQKESFAAVTESNFVKEVVTRADGTETTFDASEESQKEAVTGVTGGLGGFYFTDCADYHVTEDTLADYGLSESERTKVVLVYKDTGDDNAEKELTFYVGSLDESGSYYYVQLDGSQMVNRVLTDSVETALGWKSAGESEE